MENQFEFVSMVSKIKEEVLDEEKDRVGEDANALSSDEDRAKEPDTDPVAVPVEPEVVLKEGDNNNSSKLKSSSDPLLPSDAVREPSLDCQRIIGEVSGSCSSQAPSQGEVIYIKKEIVPEDEEEGDDDDDDSDASEDGGPEPGEITGLPAAPR